MLNGKKAVIGWREWVTLPDFKSARIKAKIDSGARTSALHAYDLKVVRRRGKERVRFKIHPWQRNTTKVIAVEAELIDHRWVTSSSGHRMRRPVVSTRVELMGREWEIELTLTNRDEMGFRMLLGRQAIRRRFLVNPGRSFVAGAGPSAEMKARRRVRAHSSDD